jgi:hypothetical protein
MVYLDNRIITLLLSLEYKNKTSNSNYHSHKNYLSKFNNKK